MPLLFGHLTTQQNNEVLWRWRRFRRERGTFLLLLASLRVSSVQPPSPPQRVTYPALSPEPQRGGGEREGGQGEPFDKLSSIKKAPGLSTRCFLAHPWE